LDTPFPLSRTGIDVTKKYAVLLPALQKIEDRWVMDGELCALDAQGRSRFQLLQNALNKKAKLLHVVLTPFSWAARTSAKTAA
jgi:bifunctional non-homologous end joining protein LigD